jgi:hypothetical protein
LTKLLVVDASVAVAACHTPMGFASLHGHKLLAPPLMVTEASSALHEMAWRGEVTKPRAKTMLGRLLKAPVEIRALQCATARHHRVFWWHNGVRHVEFFSESIGSRSWP